MQYARSRHSSAWQRNVRPPGSTTTHAKELKSARGRKGPVAVLTIRESRQLIASCTDLTSDRSMPDNLKVDASDALSAVCIMLFAGVRPAEIKRLTWRNLDLEEGTLFIANTAAKTDRSREIAMPETLIAWLEYAKANKDESKVNLPAQLGSKDQSDPAQSRHCKTVKTSSENRSHPITCRLLVTSTPLGQLWVTRQMKCSLPTTETQCVKKTQLSSGRFVRMDTTR